IGGSTFILTMSMLFRNLEILRDYPKEANHIKNGDNFLTSILGQYGKGKFMGDIKPAVYRRHSSGIWSKLTEEQKTASKLTSYYWTYQYFNRVQNSTGQKAFLNKIAQSLNKIDKEHNLIVIKKGILSKYFSFLSKLFKH
ncbi:MAG: hypothetical protein EA341_00960, partial [Mongoliibacter sp.]|uniref:hypothetical protein n=1 Tax=Mongoliibacter sp. TaxID=2022438 RepID=UPI0012F3BA95